MVQKKIISEMRIFAFLGGIYVCLNKSSDCLVALLVEPFWSLTSWIIY